MSKFAENNILYYDPSEDACNSDEVSELSTQDQNFPTATLKALENEKIKEKAEKMMDRYNNASRETGIPWQALAALHYREGGMREEASILNGENRKSSPYTNVDKQTIYPDANKDAKQAANHLIAMAKQVYGVDLKKGNPTTEDWGNAFLAYNRGNMYKSAGEQYTSSPYVMNGYDEQHKLRMKWIHADSYANGKRLNSVEGKFDSRPGALTVFAYLGGESAGNSSNSDSGVAGGCPCDTKDSQPRKIDGEKVDYYEKVSFYNKHEGGANAAWKGLRLESGMAAKAAADNFTHLNYGDVVHVQSSENGEGSYANDKYFLIVDTGSAANTLDIFVDNDDSLTSSPYGKANATITKIASGYTWKKFKREFQGNKDHSMAGSTVKSSGASVTIIGDSITEGAKTQFKERLPEADIHSKVSKHFAMDASETTGGKSGLNILEELANSNNLGDTLVFALGSNDADGIKRSEADKVLKLAGDDRKIIFVTNYSTANTYAKNNKLFIELQEKNPTRVKIADWGNAVKSAPDKYLSKDGLHPNAEGSKLFVKTIAEAIDGFETIGECRATLSNNSTNPITDDGYTFPLAGATKANVLNRRNNAGRSELSPLPCASYGEECHHDSPAVDTGLRASMAGYSGHSKSESYLKYSEGVKVVALVAGKITNYSSGYNDDPECASISYKGEDGRNYWFGHTYYNKNIKNGDTFKVGEEITTVGSPHCALVTQAHLHVNTTSGICTRSNRSGCTKDAIDIINKAFEALPNK